MRQLPARVPGLHVQPWRDGEALLRQRDRRLEEVLPRQLSVFRMRGGEQADLPRHADRDAAHIDVVAVARLAVRAEEAIRSCRRRRGHAPVIAVDVPVARGPVHQVPAAAGAGGLRLDQAEHEGGGDGRVHGRPATLQDVTAGCCRVRIGRGDHE
jgi:hypothetical protein